MKSFGSMRGWLHKGLLALGMSIGGCAAGVDVSRDGGANAAQPMNVLLICVDDLRPELKSFGAEHIHSPHMDALAAQGRAFHRHYVNAPSCGPSRYAMLTGLYPVRGRWNQHLMWRAEEMAADAEAVLPSMPEWFREHGYQTVAIGKVSHHVGGLYGKGWADPNKPELPNAWDLHMSPSDPWGNPQGTMHGYANGKLRIKDSGEDYVFESIEGPDTIYPDGLITVEGLQQLEALAKAAESSTGQAGKPFFLAIGLIKPHLPFGAPKTYLDLYDGVTFPVPAHTSKPAGRTTWGNSSEFMGYFRWGKNPRKDTDFADEVRRHYAACVSYADKHVGDILAKLKETGADQNTIVVLWGDHGWHLGEHSVWGKHTLFEESLHAPLIVSYPGMDAAGQSSDAVVETVDLFPTLCDLAGLPAPDFTAGRSLKPMLDDPAAPGHAALAIHNLRRTIRTETHRLIEHQDGYVELYDHTTTARETRNIAEAHPDLVAALIEHMEKQMPRSTLVLKR